MRVRVPLQEHHCDQGLREEDREHEASPHAQSPAPSPLGPPRSARSVFLQGLCPSLLAVLGVSQSWGTESRRQ